VLGFGVAKLEQLFSRTEVRQFHVTDLLQSAISICVSVATMSMILPKSAGPTMFEKKWAEALDQLKECWVREYGLQRDPQHHPRIRTRTTLAAAFTAWSNWCMHQHRVQWEIITSLFIPVIDDEKGLDSIRLFLMKKERFDEPTAVARISKVDNWSALLTPVAWALRPDANTHNPLELMTQTAMALERVGRLVSFYPPFAPQINTAISSAWHTYMHADRAPFEVRNQHHGWLAFLHPEPVKSPKSPASPRKRDHRETDHQPSAAPRDQDDDFLEILLPNSNETAA
jgi:hypothetical protein